MTFSFFQLLGAILPLNPLPFGDHPHNMSLPTAGGLELDDLWGPFKPKTFCDPWLALAWRDPIWSHCLVRGCLTEPAAPHLLHFYHKEVSSSLRGKLLHPGTWGTGNRPGKWGSKQKCCPQSCEIRPPLPTFSPAALSALVSLQEPFPLPFPSLDSRKSLKHTGLLTSLAVSQMGR